MFTGFEDGTDSRGRALLSSVIVADISKVECLDEAVMAGLDFHVATENDPVYGDMLQGGMRSPEMIYTEALGPELTKLPDSVTVVVPF